MTSDQKAVLNELQKLKRELSVTVEYFATMAHQGIAYIPVEVMEEVISSGRCVDRAIEKYKGAVKEEEGK